MIFWPEHVKYISYIYLFFFPFFFFNDVCIQNSIPEKSSYKMISWPEHTEDISYIYLMNQKYPSLFLIYLQKRYKKE